MRVHIAAIVFGTAFHMVSPSSEFTSSENSRSALPPSTCEIQMENTQHLCIPDYNYYSAGSVTELSFNGSEGTWSDGTVYSNISVGFPRGSSGILQLVRIGDAEHIHWQINLNRQFLADEPFSLLLRRIPFDLLHTSLRKIKPFGLQSFIGIEQDPCRNSDNLFKCRILMDLKIDMKPKSRENKLEFALTNEWTDPLKLELHGRQCDSSCDDPRPPCPNNLTVFEWPNPMRQMAIYRLIAAHYCARAVFSVRSHDCCAIHTRSVLVQYGQSISHTEHRFHLSQFFYYVFVFLALVIVLTVSLYCRTTKRVIRSRSRDPKAGAEAPLRPRAEETAPRDIFLVYPDKGQPFMNLMCTFRALLQGYSKKVWDPHEDGEVENVIANPAKWMQSVLMIEGMKIVLVETMEANQWYRSDNRTVDIDERDIYLPVLSFLHNQPQLIYDYRRLHVVRFDKMVNDRPMLNIVPQKRYKMPYQIGLLIRDLTNAHEDTMETENDSPVLHRFYKATEDYQSSQG